MTFILEGTFTGPTTEPSDSVMVHRQLLNLIIDFSGVVGYVDCSIAMSQPARG